jgi:TPP-dependent pyruvate/acetoin dehydrogenase alpha subunit
MMFHEAVNLAAIWDAPVLFVCENNVYAEFTDSRTMSRVPRVADRATAYGIAASTVDGNDVEAVHTAAREAVELCRTGRGPFLLEAETYRWHGHYEGDAQRYKPAEESEAWRALDPLGIAEGRLLERGAGSAEDLASVRARERKRVEAAVERARAAPPPGPKEAHAHVFNR